MYIYSFLKFFLIFSFICVIIILSVHEIYEIPLDLLVIYYLGTACLATAIHALIISQKEKRTKIEP